MAFQFAAHTSHEFSLIELEISSAHSQIPRNSFHFRMRVAKRTDDRVSVMNELIQGIQVIKMYAWETPFRNVVKLARTREVDQIQWASYIRGVYLSTMVFTERSTLFIAILACIYEGRAITADLVFSMATFFNVLQLTAAIYYPLAVSLGAEALVRVHVHFDPLSVRPLNCINEFAPLFVRFQ
jgi:ABC transporter transmembrane region